MIGFGVQSGSSDPEAINTWTEQQNEISQLLNQYLQAGTTSYTPYSGEYSTPLTESEQALLDWTSSTAEARQEALERLLSGESSTDINEEYATNLADAYAAQYQREYETNVEPAITASYAGPGYWGTARANAQVEGAQDLATQIATKRAETMYDLENKRIELAESAANRAAMYGASSAATEQEILQTAADLESGQADEEVAAQYQQWLDESGASNPWIALMMQYLGLNALGIGTSSDSTGFNFGILSGG